MCFKVLGASDEFMNEILASDETSLLVLGHCCVRERIRTFKLALRCFDSCSIEPVNITDRAFEIYSSENPNSTIISK